MPGPTRLAALLALAPGLALATAPTMPVTPADPPGRAVHGGAAIQRPLLSAMQPLATAALLDIRSDGRTPRHSRSQEDPVVTLVARGPVFRADGTGFDAAALRPHEAGGILIVPHGNSDVLEARDGAAMPLAIPARREALRPAIAARLPVR